MPVMVKTEDVEVLSHLHDTLMKLKTIGFQIGSILYTNPCVVDAVTDTTIIVAAGIISLRSTLVTSRSFCNSCEDESRQSVINMKHILVWNCLHVTAVLRVHLQGVW